MGKKTRKEKILENTRLRLEEIEKELLSSPELYTNAQYETLVNEAIQARELIRILSKHDYES